MDEVYLGFREQAFSINAEDINIDLENSEQVFAIVVDIPISENIATLFCSIDGTVSMYYSNGKFDIGLGEKEVVRKAAVSLLISSGQCLPFVNLYENHIIDHSAMQVFMFFLDGIKTMKIDIAHSKTKEEKFMNFLIQNVLTAIRIN
ncbi:MAG TPA: hypothetical protein VIL99_08965 [Ignavibacteria bacterium]